MSMVRDERVFTAASWGLPPRKRRTVTERAVFIVVTLLVVIVLIVLVRRVGQQQNEVAQFQRYIAYSQSISGPNFPQQPVDVAITNEDTMALNGTGVVSIAVTPKRNFFKIVGYKSNPTDHVLLKVRVYAPTFGLTPALDEVQPFTKAPSKFDWILTANQSGNQFFYIRGIVYRQTAKGSVKNRVTFASIVRVIQVTRPLVPLSTDNWMGLITTLLGSGGIIVAIVQVVRARDDVKAR
jgi:hypothetical protein